MPRIMVLLLYVRVVGLGRALVQNGRPRVVERGPRVMRAITVRLLALIVLMRVLW